MVEAFYVIGLHHRCSSNLRKPTRGEAGGWYVSEGMGRKVYVQECGCRECSGKLP